MFLLQSDLDHKRSQEISLIKKSLPYNLPCDTELVKSLTLVNQDFSKTARFVVFFGNLRITKVNLGSHLKFTKNY